MSEATFKPVETGGDLSFISAKKLSDDGVTGPILTGTYIEAIKNRFDGVDYKFEKEDGSSVIVNGCGSLNHKMKAVTPGSLVRLEYEGKKVLESGRMKGKEAHLFEVLVAE